MGPLGASTSERWRAFGEMLLVDPDDLEEDTEATIDNLWAEVVAAPLVTVWTSRQEATEHAGYLELVHRRDAPIFVIDVIDFVQEHDCDARAFAITPSQVLIDCRAADRASILDEHGRTRARQTWARLRDEGSLLRIIDGDELRSVPITYFDDFLLSQAGSEWKPLIHIVGYALGRAADNPAVPQIRSDMFAVARLLDLVDRGKLELDTDDAEIDIRTHRVRRPG